jgi:hypothetical protein
MNFSSRTRIRMLATNSSGHAAILSTFVRHCLFTTLPTNQPSNFAVFVIDEISDDQNGGDVRATGQIFLDTMFHPEREDDRTLAKITRESVTL